MFIHRDIQKMTGHSPMQATLADPALSKRIELDDLLQILTAPAVPQFYNSVPLFQSTSSLTHDGLVCRVGEPSSRLF